MKLLTSEWVEKAEAVNFRYPGESANKEEAADVLKICREFRKVARFSLDLKS